MSWPELEVYFNTVTDHLSTATITDPNSRKLLEELTDCDVSHEAFCFMDWQKITANLEQLAAVEVMLGMPLLLTPLTSIVKGTYSIRWMSPDEWLTLVPGLERFSIESQFRDAKPGRYSLVNSSGGSTELMLSGDNAVELLQKSTTIDWHLSVFPVGKVVSTLFAKSTATIRRTDDQRFELIIRLSFAVYIWLWIQDASLEYGLIIEA